MSTTHPSNVMPHSVNTQCPLILYFAVDGVPYMVSALEEVESLLVLLLMLQLVLQLVWLLLQPVVSAVAIVQQHVVQLADTDVTVL